MTAAYDKLKTLLRELFQLDQADLDFGIYRILHARKAEIDQFLDRDLLPRVKAAFAHLQTAGQDDIAAELAKAITAAQGLGVDPESTAKVRELRARLAAQPDLARLEYETYDHLWRFFSRYYSEGDFLSKRVYRDGVYAIPYDGSEVVLHWANKDQYYIKTSENLRDYAFRLRPDDAARPMRVHFRLVDAEEGAHNNVKAGEDQARVFILAPGGESGRNFLALDGEDLVIHFEYRMATLADGPAGGKKPPKQKELAALAVQRLLAVTGDAALEPWIAALAELAPTEADPKRSVLAKHLDRYVKRNTFDYFIHKDLGGFLRRELDHFLKTEVMRLDDIDHADAPRVEQYLATIKVIRRIAHAIIDFLAQVEDFQKKLWLKKKFVTGSRRLVRLDLVPEALLTQVCANAAQRQAWVKLHGIDQIAASTVAVGYSEPLTVEFLKQQPSLMVDTGLFDAGFGEALCEHLGDLDEVTDGVVLHSENFQALSLMQRRYKEQVQCVYADPPYNTGNDGFLYRDGYKSSSWLSLLMSSISLIDRFISDSGSIFVSIDNNQRDALKLALDSNLGSRFLNSFTWVSNLKGRQISSSGAAATHEYILCYANGNAPQFIIPVSVAKELMPSAYRGFNYETERDDRGEYVIKNELYNSNSIFNEETRPNLVYTIFYNPESGSITIADEIDSQPPQGFVAIKPKKNNNGIHLYHAWRWGKDKVVSESYDLKFELSGSQWRVYTKVRGFNYTFLKDIVTDINTTNGTDALLALGNSTENAFTFSKPPQLISSLLSTYDDSSIYVDPFAGSGTTAHAVINLNRADGGRRKFILTEMADYCETVLIPRIQKVTYSPEWKDGRPQRLATAEEAERGPRVVLVQRLESYEDTLNNLELRRAGPVQEALDLAAAQAPGGFRDQYLLRYLLDLESRGSASLLNTSAFLDPLNYHLSVTVPGSDERRPVAVDLIETFTWLLGLRVHSQRARQLVNATLQRAEDADLPAEAPRRLVVAGALRPDPAGPWWFKPIEGIDPDGRRVLVIWRNRPGGDTAEGLERDNAVLNAWVQAQGYAARDFNRIYVNGDNQIENLRQGDQSWTVRLIDTDFAALMFATAEGGV